MELDRFRIVRACHRLASPDRPAAGTAIDLRGDGFRPLNQGMTIRYYYSESTGHEAIASGGAPLFYPRHVHMRHWTVGLVRRGMAELESPAGKHRINTAEFFLVPPRMPHSLRIAHHSEILALCLDEKFIMRHARDFFPSMHQFVLPRECELFDGMIGQLVQHSCSLEKPQARGVMRRLAQRLIEHPEETPSVAEMARIACVSPWHFLRRFHSETGMTPHAFLLNCKIRYLRSLLRSRVLAADAAMLAGFTDQSHMHKLFKLHHNLTPRQFALASSKLDDASR